MGFYTHRDFFYISVRIGAVMENEKEIRNTILKMVSRKEYTRHEINEKLQSQFPEDFEVIHMLLDEAETMKWICDKRYCEFFIQHHQYISLDGPLKIQLKLQQKGVDKKTIESELANHYPPEIQKEVIEKIIQKKESQWNRKQAEKSEYALRQYKYEYLLRKGFSSSIIGEIDL